MLRLPRFEVVSPTTVAGAIEALARPGARLVAGGTDLLPNLKHRLGAAQLLVSLSRVDGLGGIEIDDTQGVVRIGAGATLAEIAGHAGLAARFPSLARAAGLVASPLIRNMGTIGGNLNLDTRCRYVNQSAFWRSAIGGCLKSEGEVCHVVPGGKSCVAALSSDCAPVLATLDARLVQVGPDGEREVAVADYYNTEGTAHTNRRPGELTARVLVPLPAVPTRATYVKWAVRKSIDFPLISLAVRLDLDADSADATITGGSACLGVLASRPKLVSLTALAGAPLAADETADALAQLVSKAARPLENVPYEAPYRKKMLPVHARRAMAELVSASR